MARSAGIIPSNASPRPLECNIGPPSSVLNASTAYTGTALGPNALQNNLSINQVSYLNFSDHDQGSASMPYLTGNTFPRYPSQPSAQIHPQGGSRHRYTWPSWNQPISGKTISQSELSMDEESRRLYARVQSCEQYRKYRERQSKLDKDDGDHKWPDNLEEAFFRALVRYPPMGRGKQLHKEKQHGRNELIADFIKELTGESRNRKQVSSHIQVLKPFFANDAQVMKYFSSKDVRPHFARIHRYSFGSGATRKSSGYPVTGSPRTIRSAVVAVSTDKSLDLWKRRYDEDFFKPVELHMFTQRRYHSTSGPGEAERLHTYTQSPSTPMEADLEMRTWQQFGEDYPILSVMHADERLNCTILVAEASLTFPVESFKTKPGNDSQIEVGISFRCTSRSEMQVKCRYSFYHNGRILDRQESSGEGYHHLLPFEQSGRYEAWLNFGSRFWARTLSTLDQRLRDTNEMPNVAREDVKAQIRNITMIEEVFLPVRQSYERILVMHWIFRLSSTTKGRATWRKLLLPPCGDETRQQTEERDDSVNDGSVRPSEPSPLITQHDQHAVYPLFGYHVSSLPTSASTTWPTSTSSPSFQQNNSFGFTPYGGLALTVSGSHAMTDPHAFSANCEPPPSDLDLSTSAYPSDPSLQTYSDQWPNHMYRYEGQSSVISPMYAEESQDEKHGHSFENWTGFLESQNYRGGHYTQAYEDGNE